VEREGGKRRGVEVRRRKGEGNGQRRKGPTVISHFPMQLCFLETCLLFVPQQFMKDDKSQTLCLVSTWDASF